MQVEAPFAVELPYPKEEDEQVDLFNKKSHQHTQYVGFGDQLG